LLKELYPNLELHNLSNSEDTKVLQEVLASKKETINIGHTGTAMRFLTAYYANKKGKTVILTGSNRMQKRPIKILVDALLDLGADIKYVKKEGYPPLKITGKNLLKDKVTISGDVSSQYITALMLIAPSLKNGLEITLTNKITSKPYINMTLQILNKLEINSEWKENKICIYPKNEIKKKKITIESDWSSASYFYSFIALSEGSKISLKTFFKNSLQGDSALSEIYTKFGVKTLFQNQATTIQKKPDFVLPKHLKFNFNDTPDLAQTVAVTCFGLGISCAITGLHTLKIKETDRLIALKNELQKLGAKVRITEDSIHIKPTKLKDDVIIKTYDDHRMAMAFAPLALKTPINIENHEVVAKSYPDFWQDITNLFQA
ncbi:MAG TPA: 3-phosphoshikimate 1-carboxyvinyltransferase, partial [Flavobacteriia bacterium]|nr:3-phosphoshikimate 1-carboxyvinyltransferase [Flavobacteriia bacterium]